ncbi:MAG: Hpt domain-containing protein [Magnetococcales bacterium]|nr:Hpt domain-containing protein [Magnetococcales bacterium]
MMMLGFQRDFTDAAARIRTHLTGKRQSDVEAASRLLHTIKGISGNMSANTLYAATVALEKGVKEQRQAEWLGLLDRFTDALHEVLQAIAQLQDRETARMAAGLDTTGAALPLDREAVAHQLQTLAVLVQQSSGNVMGAFDQLKPLLIPVMPRVESELHCLEDALNTFSFKNAQASLERLSAQLAETDPLCIVIPAQAGIQEVQQAKWIPAFAGMTEQEVSLMTACSIDKPAGPA